VRVSLRKIGDEARIDVRDNGQGIDPAFLPHVFERFRQADGSTTRRYGGLGLGLALVSHLVEAHHGRVSAASDGQGKGSTFTVTLPLRSLETAAAGEGGALTLHHLAPFHALTMTGLHVLVVDDERDARELVATALRARGAAVTTAADAQSALRLVRAQVFSALVSDVGMPGSDGYDLIQEIHRVNSARDGVLPAVALTAYSRDEDRRRAEGAGFHAYLSKPVDLNELVSLIMRLVSTRPS
jgi:CheY-like chemotaxis protein